MLIFDDSKHRILLSWLESRGNKAAYERDCYNKSPTLNAGGVIYQLIDPNSITEMKSVPLSSYKDKFYLKDNLGLNHQWTQKDFMDAIIQKRVTISGDVVTISDPFHFTSVGGGRYAITKIKK